MVILALTTSTLALCAAATLAGAAAVLAFVCRAAAPLAAFAAMAVAGSAGLHFTSEQYWFWGVAALIAAGIAFLDSRGPEASSRTANAYAAGGALTGAATGLAIGTVATVIIAAAIGAFLGLEAHKRISRKQPAASNALATLASSGLPPVVAFTIVMLILAQLIQA